MPIKYTEAKCVYQISELYHTGNLNKLYDKDFLNRYGLTIDTKREYQEIYAQYIHSRLLDGRIPMITLSDVNKYCTIDRHDVVQNDREGIQNEECVQRDFYYGRKLLDEKYGKPIWFELQTNGHGQGKGIDLVYYNKDTFEINLFELKYNSKESLLRAVLEIQTYYQRVDWWKAVEALKARDLIQSDYISKINKYVLFNRDCNNIYDKFKGLTDNSYVKKLMDELNVGIIIYD